MIFHAKMGSIMHRNGRDLTEEDIKIDRPSLGVDEPASILLLCHLTKLLLA